MARMDAEREALATLVRSAGGRATIEPTTMLALALLSLWSGDRRDFLDRPNRVAPQLHASALLDFLAEVRPLLSDRRLPTDRGFLAWMRYQGLAVPVAELTKLPSWLADSALADALDRLAPDQRLPAGLTRPGRDPSRRQGVAALPLLVTQAANNADHRRPA